MDGIRVPDVQIWKRNIERDVKNREGLGRAFLFSNEVQDWAKAKEYKEKGNVILVTGCGGPYYCKMSTLAHFSRQSAHS
jgi:hypothetical protein